MRIKFLTWVLSIITILLIVSISNIPQVHGQCLDDQRSLLLQLKTNLKFDSSISTKLVNWNNQSTDCCHWDGVVCDDSGRVVSLDLSSESISDGFNRTSTLFRLKFLERLNLANNSFNTKRIPSSFGNLIGLTYLNLSNAGFSGELPFGLSRLTKLVTLDLSTLYRLYFPGTLPLQLENANLLRLLQNLTGLTELHLDGVNISARGSEWGQAISSSLPNLRVLSLSNCYISGPIDSSLQKLQFLSEIHLGSNNLSAPVPEFFANFSNLTTLRLSYSNLYGNFPEKIWLVPTLQTLSLEYNILLNGYLPEFPQNSFLQNLVLSYTNFSGTLPDSISNLIKLSRIEIPRCNFSGPIPISLENLSQLVYLDMSGNKFTGRIPSFQMSKNLSYIDLSDNDLSGPVLSTNFEGLSNLVNINLADNLFNGSVPLSLFTLPSLQKIQLSNNQFDEVSEFSNGSLSPLDILDLSSNKVRGPIPPYFFHFQKLSILSLSFNNFNGTIQLERFQNLAVIDFSYNSLEGEIPSTIRHLSSLYGLNLSHNALTGQIPSPLGNLTKLVLLDLSSNKLSGTIPGTLGSLIFLSFLNLSYNQLVGKIPGGFRFQTFPKTSFEGNGGLCGPPLDTICRDAEVSRAPPIPSEDGDSDSEIDDIYVCAAVGFVFGLGSFIMALVLCKRWNQWYYKHVDQVLERIFNLEERRRRRIRTQRAYRNPIRRL